MELVSVAAPPEAAIERAVRVGQGQLIWLRSKPFAVRCEPGGAEDDLKVVVAVDGRGALRQAGRDCVLEAGTFSWLQSDVPFELSMSSGRLLLFRMPLSLVRGRHPELDLRMAVQRGKEHAGERFVAHVLDALAREGRTLSHEACASAANIVLDGLGMCARAETVDNTQTRIERAIANIELRLGDPALQPEDISREQGVSRRYLDGILRQRAGRTLADHIRLRRLERAADDLQNRPAERTADVATRWGFRDASHFARLFRSRYASTPTEYRQARVRKTGAPVG